MLEMNPCVLDCLVEARVHGHFNQDRQIESLTGIKPLTSDKNNGLALGDVFYDGEADQPREQRGLPTGTSAAHRTSDDA